MGGIQESGLLATVEYLRPSNVSSTDLNATNTSLA